MGAWAVVAAGIAAPRVRRRFRLHPAVVLPAVAAVPFAFSVALPRSRPRDVVVCLLQMYAYVAAYEMPNDNPEALARRVHIAYPVRIDTALGLGVPMSLRLQRFARPGRLRLPEKVLVWAHWIWFTVPHSTLLYTLLRRPERFPRAAVLTYAVFDLGVIGYWLLPTAPPWYAAREGVLSAEGDPELRRMMLEHGEKFWGTNWGRIYGVLGGNPLAAMPSLHFATSVMAAHMLSELGPVEKTVGWTYAATLGFALVYLGEHYVVDLLAGLALTEGIRAGAPHLTPVVRRIAEVIRTLEAQAHA